MLRFQKKSKGQVFLLSILLLSAVLVMGMTLIIISTRDLKLAYQSSESTKALYAADSEMERLLYWTLVLEKDEELEPVFDMDNGTSKRSDDTHFSFYSEDSYLSTLGYNKATPEESNVARGMKINFQVLLP